MNEIPPKAYHRHIPHDADDTSAILNRREGVQAEKDVGFFEKQIVCIHHLLISKGYLPSLDAIRRAAEEVDGLCDRQQSSADMPASFPDFFPGFLKERLPEYGERRVLAVEEVFCEMGFVTREELHQTSAQTPDEMAKSETTQAWADAAPKQNPYSPQIDDKAYPNPKYSFGDSVQVSSQAKPGHIRVPAYLFGKSGKIVGFQGMFSNPEAVAHLRANVVRLPLYLVEFEMMEVWGDRCTQRSRKDTIRAEIYEPWLSHPGYPKGSINIL